MGCGLSAAWLACLAGREGGARGQIAWDARLACSEAWNTSLLSLHALSLAADRRDLGFLHSSRFCRARSSVRWRAQPYANVSAGDIVVLHARHLRAWMRHILPAIPERAPFALVTLGDDAGVPGSFASRHETSRLLSHRALAGWWATNPDHPSVHPLPLGLNFHDQATHIQLIRGFRWPHLLQPSSLVTSQRSPQQQEQALLTLIAALPPTMKRSVKAWADFQFDSDNPARIALWRQMQASSRTRAAIVAPRIPLRR